jgi:hypothetical protein
MATSREQFEYEAGQALCLPTSIIELARKGDGYDHAFDSMNILQPLNGWWAWWKNSRASIVVELPQRQEPTSSGHYGEGYLVPNTSGTALDYDDTVDAIRSAGITVKGEGDE